MGIFHLYSGFSFQDSNNGEKIQSTIVEVHITYDMLAVIHTKNDLTFSLSVSEIATRYFVKLLMDFTADPGTWGKNLVKVTTS